MAKKVFKDSNANRYFARDYISQQYDYGAAPSSVSRTEDNKKLSIEQYKDKRSSYNFKNVFRESYSSGQQVRLDGLEPKDMFISDSYTVTATDETFVKDFLYNDFSFEDKYGDEIPVVVPKDFVIALESNGFLGNSKAKYVVFKNGVDKYIGKSYTVINTPFQTEGGAETPGFKEEKFT